MHSGHHRRVCVPPPGTRDRCPSPYTPSASRRPPGGRAQAAVDVDRLAALLTATSYSLPARAPAQPQVATPSAGAAGVDAPQAGPSDSPQVLRHRKKVVYRALHIEPARRGAYVRSLGISGSEYLAWWREMMPPALPPHARVELGDVIEEMRRLIGRLQRCIVWDGPRMAQVAALSGGAQSMPSAACIAASRPMRRQWAAVLGLHKRLFLADVAALADDQRRAAHLAACGLTAAALVAWLRDA